MGSLHQFYVIRLLSAWVHWQSALLAQQAQMTSHHKRQKNYGLHTIACDHNIVCANQSVRTYFFSKQTASAYHMSKNEKNPLTSLTQLPHTARFLQTLALKWKCVARYWRKAKNTMLQKIYPQIFTSAEIPKEVTEQLLLSL